MMKYLIRKSFHLGGGEYWMGGEYFSDGIHL